MSFINNSGFFFIDTPTYISTNGGTSTVTAGDIFENCVLPAMKRELSNECFYFEKVINANTSYPCIAIPKKDGTCGEDLYLYLALNVSTAIGTNYQRLAIYSGGSGTGYGAYQYSVATGGGTSGTTMNESRHLHEQGIAIRYIVEDEFVAYGLFTTSSSNFANIFITANLFVTEVKDLNDNVVPYVMYMDTSNRVNGNLLIGGTPSGRTMNIQSPNTEVNGCALINKLEMGDYSNDNLYVVSSYYASIRGMWSIESSGYKGLLQQSEYQDTLWYENAFTVDGQSFDAWIGSDSSNTNAILLRKHVLEG